MTGLALFFAGALVGGIIVGVAVWAAVTVRSADDVVNLQAENALLQRRIAQGDAVWLAEHQIDASRVADEREAS